MGYGKSLVDEELQQENIPPHKQPAKKAKRVVVSADDDPFADDEPTRKPFQFYLLGILIFFHF